MKLLVILLITFSVVSCSLLPAKPSLVMCIIDYPAAEIICGRTKSENMNFKELLNEDTIKSLILASDEIWRLPLKDADKYICMPPREFKVLKDYIDTLEDYAKQHCK